jgi:beta-galactosidase
VRDYCERVHLEGAQALAAYKSDFYAGMPALTRHRQGAGQVYYLGARPAADAFHDALAASLVRELKLERCLDVELPEGVTVQKRSGGGRTFLFLHNLKGREQALDLGALRLTEVSDGRTLTGRVTLAPYASLVLEKARG